MSWTGPEYALMNLRTIKENIAAFASYVGKDLHEQVEAAQNGIENLIKAIERYTEKRYEVQIRSTGDVLADGLTLEEAEAEVASQEAEDKKLGMYFEDWYEIVEMEE